MDIGQYIGKFLVKNKYCSLSGLGVFELQKNAASIRHQDNTVAPLSHLITFNPVGSIDDSFASFIASRENVSISNASNNIKEYCIKAKQELNETGQFNIEHIGKLTLSNQKISFTQSSDLDLGYEPVAMPAAEIKTNATKSNGDEKLDFSYPPSSKNYQTKSTPVMKYVMLGGVALLLLGGVYMAYDYYQKNKIDTDELVRTNSTPAPSDQTTTNTSSIPTDTSSQAASVNTPSTNNTPSVSPGSHLVAVFSFSTQAAADAKAKKLTNYGNKASVIQKDSANFVVTLEASHPLGDTTRLVDSLRKFFNPKGNVYIWK